MDKLINLGVTGWIFVCTFTLFHFIGSVNIKEKGYSDILETTKLYPIKALVTFLCPVSWFLLWYSNN